jgi:hypothetical protein
MARGRKLSVCYLVPWAKSAVDRRPDAQRVEPARALARHTEFTVTFRSVLDEHAPADVRVAEVQPGVGCPRMVDDAAMRG